MSKVKVGLLIAMVGISAITVMKWRKGGKQNRALNEPIQEEIIPASHDESDVMMPVLVEEAPPAKGRLLTSLSDDSQVPRSVDRMALLFKPYVENLPIVETVTYASKVAWLNNRPAYLGDYASRFRTSKHFISRSLHGDDQYLSDVVSKGDRFNVLRTDHDIEFHLVVDLSRCKMWVYSYDATDENRLLLKDYKIAVGKPCAGSPSGCLTPIGVYQLGEEIAVYKEGMQGYRQQQKIDMISVFGKRWIPFGKEIANCTGPAKGFGIHGMPYRCHPLSEEWTECTEAIGEYSTDGCIRLLSDDLAELFAVIVSRPSFVHVVRDFTQAKLPGNELL